MCGVLHCTVFSTRDIVLSAERTNSEEPLCGIQTVKNMCEQLNNLNPPVQLFAILTHVDHIKQRNIAKHPEELRNSSKVHEWVESFREVSRLPKSHVCSL
jgi:hypothetical protein